MSGPLAFEDLERAYDLLADGIDAAGQGRETLFLTKLCLALAHQSGDLSILEQSIAIAATDLDV